MVKQQIEVEANTVEDAIDQGLKRLGTNQSQTDIEIIQEPSSDIFDQDVEPARVRLSAESVDLLELLNNILDRTLRLMGLENFDVEVWIDGDLYRAAIKEIDNPEHLIGPDGKALNSLQHIMSRILSNISDQDQEVVIDVGGYREKRRDKLEALATEQCEAVISSNEEVKLDPMIPYERKIIHGIVRDYPELKSHSIGEGTNRRVVIRPEAKSE